MDETDNLRIEIEQVRNELNALKQIVSEHGHVFGDGSSALTKAIALNDSEPVRSGFMGIEGIPYDGDKRLWEGAIVLGSDEKTSNQSNNSQVNYVHYFDRQSGIWSSFLLGLRAPLYSGKTGSVVSGGSTMSQSDFSWSTNALSAASVVVFDTDLTTFNCYDVSANAAGSLTVTGGTWRFTNSAASFTVYSPVYVGSAEYPWRRFYTSEGTSGGLRFGQGMTNAGQKDNGLLYMDSAGDLYWRNKAGSATKLN